MTERETRIRFLGEINTFPFTINDIIIVSNRRALWEIIGINEKSKGERDRIFAEELSKLEKELIP